ncbi:MAG TPA: GAF domain-containing protein [Candidatus Izemoplasmatales bacterium]|nr:GAF domain-containing protein [Candidatus Izemoplasmatales bacterium]
MDMFSELPDNMTYEERAILFLETLAGYLDKNLPRMTNLSNFAAIVKAFYPELNWAGFYLLESSRLFLGPFQGLPACVSIDIGRGVCGLAAETRETIVVDDVTEFLGHIACDSLSCSEMVIPVLLENTLIGVLDLDSPEPRHFGEKERVLFMKAVNVLVDFL